MYTHIKYEKIERNTHTNDEQTLFLIRQIFEFEQQKLK
jgi:hypothetical protein